MLLKNKNVIRTGTARGMGKAMLTEFAKNGANIWACARKETPEFLKNISEISKEYNVEIKPIFFDLTDLTAMKSAIIQIRNEKKNIDALINNAGITYNALFAMSDSENLKKQFDVNFFSLFTFTQYIVKIMSRQKYGSIVNIASSAAFDGNPGKSVYGASKAAVVAMTKSIAAELGEIGIRANCIAPGVTDTDMIDTMPKHIVEDAVNHTDLLRIAKPSEIATTAVFLASDLSSYVTGQTIIVSGGLK